METLFGKLHAQLTWPVVQRMGNYTRPCMQSTGMCVQPAACDPGVGNRGFDLEGCGVLPLCAGQ